MEDSIIIPGTPEKKGEAKSGYRRGLLGYCDECGRELKGNETIWILGDGNETICDICIENRTVQPPQDIVPETPEKEKMKDSVIVPETPEGNFHDCEEKGSDCCRECRMENEEEMTRQLREAEIWEERQVREARVKGGNEEEIPETQDEDVHITELYQGAEKLTRVMLEHYTQNFSSDNSTHIDILLKLFEMCEYFDLRIQHYNYCSNDNYADLIKRCRRSCKIMMKKFMENLPKTFYEEHKKLFYFMLRYRCYPSNI